MFLCFTTHLRFVEGRGRSMILLRTHTQWLSLCLDDDRKYLLLLIPSTKSFFKEPGSVLPSFTFDIVIDTLRM